MRKHLVPLFVVALSGLIWGQQVDSVTADRIHTLEQQVDSMQKAIHLLNSELQELRENRVQKGSDVDKILSLFVEEEDAENIPKDQRSRRKRVDALLEAVMKRPGQLRFNGGATASLQGKSDWNNHRTSGVASFDFFATTSFGPHTLLFIDLESIGGNGLDEIFSTFSGLNDDAGSTQDEDGFDRITVLEGWAEFTVLQKMFTITAGKIDLTNYFDNNASANDETIQFLSSAFVNSAAFAVPANSPGMRIRTTLLNRFYVQVGVASSDNSGLDLLDDLYKIGSIGFKVLPDSTWETNIRFYAFRHPAAEDAIGYGLSFDQNIFGICNVFGRFGRNEDDLADFFGISSAWSAGTHFAKKMAGRMAVLGIGFGEIEPGLKNLKKEKLLEIYIRHQLNRWVHVSPHLQLVRNAKGSSEQFTIVGFRTHFNF